MFDPIFVQVRDIISCSVEKGALLLARMGGSERTLGAFLLTTTVHITLG